MESKIRLKINTLTEKLFEMFPEAITELEYENNFQLLVAIIMSAQTTDKQVNIVNKEFFKVLKTPQDGVKLGENTIKKYISQVNFFNNKAKHIYQTCEILSDENSLGEILKSIPFLSGPKEQTPKIPGNVELFPDALTQLPGVGTKTAKVFLSIVYHAPFLGVDTHVHRVLNRVGIVNTKSPEETDKRAEKLFTKTDLAKLHHSLIYFGRYHCIARKPKCETEKCELQEICKYFDKNIKK